MTHITHIAPLIASDGARVELGWQRDRSREVLESCRPATINDWLWRGMFIGAWCGGGAALVAWIAAPVSEQGWPSPPMTLVTAAFAVVMVISVILTRRDVTRRPQRARGALASGEYEWHVRFMETHPKMIDFDERLAALKSYDANADACHGVDAAIVEKYAATRDELSRVYRALGREEALRRLELAINKSNDGRYRDTMDVSEAIFVHRARQEDADRELEVLIAPGPDERFRITGADVADEISARSIDADVSEAPRVVAEDDDREDITLQSAVHRAG